MSGMLWYLAGVVTVPVVVWVALAFWRNNILFMGNK